MIPFVAGQACQDGTTESCSINKGVCSGSVRTCYGGVWGVCSILPQQETCNNGLDDDCDGVTDEECVCKNGEERSCSLWNKGVCSQSIQRCENNSWSSCSIIPQEEVCDNLADDDCDGVVDNEDEDCFDSNHCRNNKQDYDEESIDCGGLCPPCPTCTDGKKSSRLGERKINVIIDDQGTVSDCGGLCPPCPTCTDNIKNQHEEDIDCGGSECPSCEPIIIEETTSCGNARCDENETSETCPEDCKNNSHFLLYVTLFLILFVILSLIFIFTKKRGKKKEEPVKIHSALLKPLQKDHQLDKVTEKLRKIK